MNVVTKSASVLTQNPLLFSKIVAARLRCLLPAPRVLVRKTIRGVDFEFDPAFSPFTELMFREAYEVTTVEAMRRLLRPGDTFIDVGANIGFLSAMGAGLVGQTGQVHAFEPVPRYFKSVQRLAELNSGRVIVTNHCALGDRVGTAPMDVTASSNIGWNTMVQGTMDQAERKETIDVPVLRLDAYIEEKKLARIALIKIDTEGFEFPVLRGLSGYFEKNPSAKTTILCEIAPYVYPRLGTSLDELQRVMRGYGYRAHSLVAMGREVDLTRLTETSNVLFLR